jgi:putative sterol carrier protein
MEGADCEMTIDGNDFVKMLKGELRASSAFMSGNLKIKGDVGFAMKLEKLNLVQTLGHNFQFHFLSPNTISLGLSLTNI